MIFNLYIIYCILIFNVLARFVAFYIISYIKQQFSVKTMKNKIRVCVIGMYCIYFAKDGLYAQIKCQEHARRFYVRGRGDCVRISTVPMVSLCACRECIRHVLHAHVA